MQTSKNSYHCWRLDQISLRYVHFAIIDTADYLADQLFIRHHVRVSFGKEFAAPDMLYRIIFCRVRKRDMVAFLSAMEELPNKMLLCGYTDYLDNCRALHRKISKEVRRDEKLGSAG